jgi:hypothetical protein
LPSPVATDGPSNYLLSRRATNNERQKMAHNAALAISDRHLTADQLSQKYNTQLDDGEHPIYQRGHWRQAVDARATLRGYWDWVEAQLEEDGEQS